MESNELRVGNLVNRKFLNPSPKGLKTCFNECKIVSIGIERVIYECKDKSLNKVKFDIISPIPLTEEWLLNLGFKKNNYYGYDEYLIDGYSYINGKFHIAACDDCGESVEINFVHELQNLYFSLTKKELTIM